MDPKIVLVESLIGNLAGKVEYRSTVSSSPGSKSKLKNSSQININISVAGDLIQQPVNLSIPNTQLPNIFKEGYQAVFLDNGQVYFGHLEKILKQRFVELREVFYLTAGHNEADYTLVKLGQEIHAPEDVMHIKVDNIIFWETLKDEGDIVSAILKYKSSKG